MNKFFEPELLISEYNRRNLTKWKAVDKNNNLPFWLADMDFQVCRPIKNALSEQVNDGHFGYASVPEELQNETVARLERLYHWKISPDQIIWKSGAVPFLHFISRLFGGMGGKVIVPIPAYYHLFNAPDWGGQKGIRIPFLKGDKGISFDWDKIEAVMKTGVKVFNLCNPQNPGGKVFSADSLERLANLCEKYDVLICSDELHCDLILDKKLTHIPIASLNKKIADRTFTLMSPSKTFNIAGLLCSFCVVTNPALREKLSNGMQGLVPNPSISGLKAALAAYTKGDKWLDGLLKYLAENRDILYQFFDKYPQLMMLKPHEATYLAWISIKNSDFDQLEKIFLKNGIQVSHGKSFEDKSSFRFNFGCHKKTLYQGLSIIEQSIKEL